MRTDSINNTNFQAKNFRKHAKFIANIKGSSSKNKTTLKNYMKEYENLNAETIYGEARKEQSLGNWNSAANLYRQISNINLKEKFLSFLNKFCQRINN